MTRCCLIVLLAAVLVGWAVGAARAQEPAPTQRLRIFLECSACESDYVRTELSWVDYVRDRQDADVHVLVTSLSTGTGGREYTLYFIGMRDFAGQSDTLRYVTSPDATPVITREGLVRKLKLGLVAYIKDLPIADQIQVGLVAPRGPQAQLRSEQTRDPWNYWVFTVSSNGFFNGESRQQFRQFGSSLSANRTTDAWKIRTSVRGSYGDSEFEVDSVTTIKSLRRSYAGSMLFVRSLGPNLSLGLEGAFESSTFGNTELSWRVAPAIEYNFFPYAESTRRTFTLLYSTGLNTYDYREITIFDETRERRLSHAFSIGYTTRQPWGSSSIALDMSQFLHDTQKYRVSLGASANLRLVRGLSLNFGGTYGRVRDQLSIARAGATRDQILLRLRQLRTSYFYFANFGLSYRFGSSFDNIVNPRVNRGIAGGGFFFEF